jgi:hypothetical protein
LNSTKGAEIPFSRREVAAKRPDEGLPTFVGLLPSPSRAAAVAELAGGGSPSSVGFADTFSLWEKGARATFCA